MAGKNQVNSLYIHFPHCRHLCNYCDFFKSVPDNFDEARENFQQQLERHWHQHQQLFKQHSIEFGSLETLYLGGGTPSLWGESGAKWFKSFLLKYLNLANTYEWTMEVNPKAWSEEGLAAWENLGVNRFSVGIQSYDERYLKILDRVHDLSDVKLLLKRMHNRRFSADLMLGLPFTQEYKRDLRQEIECLVESGAEHFSVYILTVKENYKHFDKLPSEELVEEEYLKTHEILDSFGFEHYEVSNFARNDARSRHNLRYWQGESVAALGPSAVGYVADIGMRYKWPSRHDEPEIEQLDQSAIKTEKLYLQLRLKEGIGDISEFISEKNHTKYERQYQLWFSQGWAQRDTPQQLRLTAQGFLMMDSVILAIMAMVKAT